MITFENVLKETYMNRHDQTAMTLQGICDSKRRFIDVSSGYSRRTHDRRVYNFSDISKQIPAITEQGRFHILGDGAYPLSKWLLIPYANTGHLTQTQKLYNTRLSQTRMLIENAFGILKMRFRQLFYGLHFHKPLKAAAFIISCYVLHNLCIDAGDECDFDIPGEIPVNDAPVLLFDNRRANRQRGERKRQRIANSLH